MEDSNSRPRSHGELPEEENARCCYTSSLNDRCADLREADDSFGRHKQLSAYYHRNDDLANGDHIRSAFRVSKSDARDGNHDHNMEKVDSFVDVHRADDGYDRDVYHNHSREKEDTQKS